MGSDAAAGSLVVVATPIGNLGDLSPRAVAALAGADAIACEDTRRTRKLLSAAGIAARTLLAVHEHNEAAQADKVVALVAGGRTVALVSDAGTPAVSDPGQLVVSAVAGAGWPVSVVPGPSAAVAAVALSGFPARRWVFEGFLPRKGRDRAARLAAVAGDERPSVVYEAPSRVQRTVADLAGACGADRRVAIGRELTKVHEEVWRGTLGEAVAHLGSVEPRGEYTLVVHGAPPPPEASDDDIDAALEARTGRSPGGTGDVRAVAAALRVPRRRVYDIELRRRGRLA